MPSAPWHCDSSAYIASHELAESITDPSWTATNGTGWFDDSTGEECGDVCTGLTTHLGTYLVQRIWSQKQNSCAVAPA